MGRPREPIVRTPRPLRAGVWPGKDLDAEPEHDVIYDFRRRADGSVRTR